MGRIISASKSSKVYLTGHIAPGGVEFASYRQGWKPQMILDPAGPFDILLRRSRLIESVHGFLLSKLLVVWPFEIRRSVFSQCLRRGLAIFIDFRNIK